MPISCVFEHVVIGLRTYIDILLHKPETGSDCCMSIGNPYLPPCQGVEDPIAEDTRQESISFS